VSQEATCLRYDGEYDGVSFITVYHSQSGGVIHVVQRHRSFYNCLPVCLSVCVCNALTLDSLDLKITFFGMQVAYIFSVVRSNSYIKVIRSGSRSQEQKSLSASRKPLQSEASKSWQRLSYCTTNPQQIE